MKYLLLCTSRTNGIAVWWRPRRRGYTTNVNDAGRYEVSEAKEIVADARDVVMIPAAWIGTEMQPRTIVDLGDEYNTAAVMKAREAQS